MTPTSRISLLGLALAVAACGSTVGDTATGQPPPGPSGGGTAGMSAGAGGGRAGTGGAAGGQGGSGGGGGVVAVDAAAGSGGGAGNAGSPDGGAATGGGGRLDAGRADGGAGGDGALAVGGPSLCTPGRFRLCEGFEGTPLGTNAPPGWTRRGNTSIADDQAARGARALKIAAAVNGERRLYFTDAESFGSAHWGRIFYRVQLPVPQPFVHSTLVTLQGSGPNVGPAEFRVVDTVKMAGAAGNHQFLFNVQPQGPEYGKGTGYNWRFDGNWHCAEWFVSGATQSYQFFIDGVEVQQIRIQNGAGNFGTGRDRTDLPQVFTDLKVGWNNYQAAAPGFVAWIDEVAVDSARIGCDR